MNTMNYSNWLRELRSLFEVHEEFDLACRIYNFGGDYELGLTPSASYAVFDVTVRCCDEVA